MSLKEEAVSGVIWSAIERFSCLFIQLLSTFIIARILSPSDFGLLGMLAIFTALGQTLLDSGFGQALIRKEDANDVDYSSVFYLNVVIGFCIYGVLYYLSSHIAAFYSIPDLEILSKIAFLVLPINALGLIQYTLLVKHVNFKSLSRISILAAFISGTLGIITAYYWKNVWALVLQNLLMYGCRTILFWILGSWRPIKTFSIKSIKEMLPFSLNLLFTGIISNIFNNLYSLVIGKVYNAVELGYYSQAERIQKIPSNSITEVVQRVSYPILAKIQNDKRNLKEGYRKIIRVVLFTIVPIMLILIGISEDLFDVLLTEKWKIAAKYFQILCVIGILYPLHSINLNILSVRGNSKLILLLEIIRKILLVCFLIFFSHFDIIYFIYSQVLYSVIVLFLNLYFCGREINYTLYQQIGDILPVLMVGASGFSVIISIKHIFELNQYLMILCQISVFIIIYLFLSYLFKLPAFFDIYHIIQKKISKK